MVFYPPAASPPSAAGALVPAIACLSQRVWKLAGEEVFACANYILIIGNVLANQALIAIMEPNACLLCRLGIEKGPVLQAYCVGHFSKQKMEA